MNRNIYITIVLMGLILFLGVGYAIVNSVTLTVTGSATSLTKDLDVSFSGRSKSSNSSKTTINIPAGSKSGTIAFNNMLLNESVCVSYEIQNLETDIKAIVNISIPASNDYFSIVMSEGNTSELAMTEEIPNETPNRPTYLAGFVEDQSGNGEIFINPNSVGVIRLCATMIKTPITSSDSEISFTTTMTASAYQNTV